MVEWRGLALQFLSAVIGSSLIVTVFTGIYTDINKPGINIVVEPNLSPGFNPYSNNEILNRSYTTIITNEGRATATDVSLLLHFPEAENITSWEIEKKTERMGKFNITDEGQTLETNLPRLAAGGSIVIDTDYTLQNKTEFFSSFNNPCTISVSYKEGGKVRECNPFSYSPFSLSTWIEILSVPIIAAIVFFLVLLLPNKFQQIRQNRKQSNFVDNIESQLKTIQDTFSNDLHSNRIFSFNIWDSLTPDNRRKIFDNFDSYKRLDNFYNELKERDSEFQSDINTHERRDHNNKCLSLAHDALENIDWTSHRVPAKTLKQAISVIPFVILSSVFITFVCEGILYYFLDPLSFEFFMISFASRALVAFFVLRYIFVQFRLVYAYRAHYRHFDSHFIQVSKKFRARLLLALSAGLIGVPNIVIVVPIFHLALFLSGNPTAPIYSDMYVVTAIIVAIDILRMSALVLVLKKLYYGISKGWNYTAAMASIFSGILHIWFASVVILANTSVPSSYLLRDVGAILPENTLDEIRLEILTFFSIIVIPVGVAEIIWSLVVIKRRGSVWFYIGIVGSTILTIMWLVTIVTMPIVNNKIQSIPADIEPLYDTFVPISLATFLIGIAVVVSQIVFLISTAIVKQKEMKTERKDVNISTNKYFIRITQKIKSNRLLLFLCCFTFFIVVSVISSAPLLSFYILNDLDSRIPRYVTASPWDVAVDPETNTIYVSNSPSDVRVVNTYSFERNAISRGGILVIDGTTNKLHGHIDIGDCVLRDISLEPKSETMYFFCSDEVSILDLNRGEEIGSIDTRPEGCIGKISVNPDENKLYLTDACYGDLSIIDLNTNEVIEKIGIGISGDSCGDDNIFNPNNNKIYITCDFGMILVDANTTETTYEEVDVSLPNFATIDPHNGDKYGSVCSDSPELVRMNRQVYETIPLPYCIDRIYISQIDDKLDTKLAYVWSVSGNEILIIDPVHKKSIIGNISFVTDVPRNCC